MPPFVKQTLFILLCSTAFGVGACKAKQESVPVAIPLPATPPPATMPMMANDAGSGSAITAEEWEDCAAAASAHEIWVGARIPTDAGKSLAAKQAIEIQKLCAYGKWPKGTGNCFDNATSAAALDKCAEKISQEQKKAVSDLFTEILNVGKAAAIGSGSAK